MKVAFITGISGQDGAYLAKLLIEKNYKVVGLVRNNHSKDLQKLKYLQIENKVEIVEGDLMELSQILNLITQYQPSEIYNLAAQSSVGLSFSQPIGTIQYNIISVLNLLESLRILKVDTKLYQASSSEMYGEVKHLPITLDTPMHPVSPYAISKASAYWSVVNYRESYNIFACNGILFNHESYLRGENFFVKKIITESLKLKKGEVDFVSVGNIDVNRDFGYSPKYVEAMWLMLQQDIPKDYIICSGKSVKLRSIIEYIFKRLDIDINKLKIDQRLYRPNEIKDIYGDNFASRTELNWDYNYDFMTVLDLIIEETIKNEK